jgi:HEAT repeat protein
LRRFPPSRGEVLAVSERGEAFLRAPDAKTTHLLEHYVELGAAGRNDPAAFGYLADMVAQAVEALALDALERLAEVDALAGKLPDSGVAMIARAASDESRPSVVQRRALALIADRRLQPARDTVLRLSKSGDSVVRQRALFALGDLDGGLSPDTVRVLLEDDDSRLREVGVTYVVGESADEILTKVVSADRAPRVRAIAAHRLVERKGALALDVVLPLLGDENALVRASVAKNVAGLGDVAIERLVALVKEGSEQEAQGGVLALSMAGPAGGKAISTIARDHSNPNIRGLAELALGKAPGHSH